MNRNRFVVPTTDTRVVQSLFSTPPPNFNWQGIPAASDYPVPNNVSIYPNVQVQQSYPQNQSKKSYCKTCNLWTSEPYESHITSSSHLINKSNEQYEAPDNLDTFKPNTRVQNQPYESNSSLHMPKKAVTNRNNISTYDPAGNPSLNIQKKVPMRMNSQPFDPMNASSQPVVKKNIIRPVIAPFISGNNNNNNSNNNVSDNSSNKKMKNRKSKMNTNQQNSMNSNQSNFANSNITDGSLHFDKNDNITRKKFDEIPKTTQAPSNNNATLPITANRGREMLLPVSGVYCTLCDEFFRNTDSAETNHCKSSTHIDAYEKLLGQLKDAHSEKRPKESSDDTPPSAKRLKPCGKPNKNASLLSKSPDVPKEIATTNIEKQVVREVSSREALDVDQSTSSEFQGPDFSLEFPDEAEDYDE